MLSESIPSLKIGNLEVNPPIIQGGMGVRVSGANLASAVANTGCVGIIASVGLGNYLNQSRAEGVKRCDEAFRHEIRKARSQSKGIIGVNIMGVLTDHDSLVIAAVEENVDLIISGAGLPLNLPGFVNGKDIKLVPVVSSARTFQIICKRWKLHFGRLPDAVIVEGPEAGGHLGYSYQDIVEHTAPKLDEILLEVISVANSFEPHIPVIAAGGIFDGKDIARVLKLGASGVQMATRFVCTEECDVHENFKKAYINATREDITVIQSPVGLPGRVINNSFVQGIKQGKTVPFKCGYQCLRTCDPQKAPYCIAEVLSKAADGDIEHSFAFAGSNAYRCKKIVPVKELVDELTRELSDALSKEKLTFCTK